MNLSVTDVSLQSALQHFGIEKLPVEWNGHHPFEQCIVLVRKTGGTVYCIGKYDEASPQKVKITHDLGRGNLGMTIKPFKAIFPVYAKQKVEEKAVKLEDNIQETNIFILPELKNREDAIAWLKANGVDTKGAHNATDERIREKVAMALEQQMKAQGKEVENPEQPQIDEDFRLKESQPEPDQPTKQTEY